VNLQTSWLGRRRFLKTATATCSLASLSTLGACASVPTLRAAVQAGRIRLQQQELDEAFAEGDALLLQSEDLPEGIYLVRSDDNLTATGATCTHLGCQVRPAKAFFRCPCHGSTFSLVGDVVRGPAARPLASYHVRVIDDIIEIELP
jgi:cytochrome b6-f complex iron-sulfur subunit